jgi:hypothetical protein
MEEIVKAAIAVPRSSTKEPQSCTSRETTKAIQDAVARYQLMFVHLTSTPGHNNIDLQIITVNFPAIGKVSKEIRNTTKVSKVVHMTQEQFTYHLAQHSTSKDFNDTSMKDEAKALHAPTVTALKRAHWADRPLSIEQNYIKDKLGIYHFAPPHTGSYAYKQCVADRCKIFQQEIVGGDKSRISTKAHNLDHAGKMDSNTDLHSTIANFSAIATFITKHAIKSSQSFGKGLSHYTAYGSTLIAASGLHTIFHLASTLLPPLFSSSNTLWGVTLRSPTHLNTVRPSKKKNWLLHLSGGLEISSA